MDDGTLIDRLKQLQNRLLQVFGEATELRSAAQNLDHPLNQWPNRERRAVPRPELAARPASGSKP